MNRRSAALLAVIMMLGALLGCSSSPEPLTPDQVDSSMLDQVVKVKGRIIYAVENPMGVGGMYMTLGNDNGSVDVRIQPDLWDGYDDSEKKIYREGRTVTVEGILFMAGEQLVVVHGNYLASNTGGASGSSD